MARTVALIAHDNKKAVMVAFASAHRDALASFDLCGTGTTAGRVADATGLPVRAYLSGPLGGDAQIAARVAEGACAGVIFLVDPLSAHPHEPDIGGLQRICNVHDVPLATNVATAEAVLAHLVAGGGARPAAGKA